MTLNIWIRKIYFCADERKNGEGKRGICLEKGNILSFIFFLDEKEKGEGKYLEKENILFAEKKEKGEGKGRKY